ncbi:Retaining alpha-galactosidase precursor [Posidoniimonas polymericola]|uniref:Retaining alpha-galactosidase n=1 Tax=Posidoniimonas polymericola TaxID=2528002 RepID=A0A5C5YER3_9BACT|nr:glycoside hydrolase family 97 protein [Posidoniimonas polymericola]TWT73830.1 Retaining alpha-galactosidase precursor [Posidoniimonas polymericola]
MRPHRCLRLSLILLAFSAKPLLAQEVRIGSPDGRNTIVLSAGDNRGPVQISVIRDEAELIAPSPCGPRLVGSGVLGKRVERFESKTWRIDSDFTLPWGKTNMVRNRAAAALVDLSWPGTPDWQIELYASDEGVAWRHHLKSPAKIADEGSGFRVNGGPLALYGELASSTTSHEMLYRYAPLAEIPDGVLLEMPLLLTWPDGPAAAITEARVRGFPGMCLQGTGTPGTLRCRLSPLPDQPGVCAVGDALISPWRVVMVADRAGELLESNLLTCLNDPPEGSFAWVKPGKTTMHWWNGEFEQDFKLPPDSTESLDRHRRYIDFCAANNIAYHMVSGDGRSWYRQSSTNYGKPSPDADVTAARPEIRLPEILAYAKEKGVGIRLWVHWRPLSEQLEEAFALYESWGVRGLMVDFLDRDDQAMNEFTERMLSSAARHKLHIQVHGSPKPSGEERTFPNLLNREGVLNLEHLKWSDHCTPDHDVNVAYARALAGLVDYHLGGFHAVPPGEFEPHSLEPDVLGSRCHQLALYVLYENPMPMVADTPERYAGEAGFDFLTACPTTWDETRFVAGEPGEYLVLARRRGDAWYLGGITNHQGRAVPLPLDFLPARGAEARLWLDASLDGGRPNTLKEQRVRLGPTNVPTIQFAPGGGFVGVLRPNPDDR